MFTEKRAGVAYADTLMLLYEGIARTVEDYQPLIEACYGKSMTLSVSYYIKYSVLPFVRINRHLFVTQPAKMDQVDIQKTVYLVHDLF